MLKNGHAKQDNAPPLPSFQNVGGYLQFSGRMGQWKFAKFVHRGCHLSQFWPIKPRSLPTHQWI